MLNGVLHTLNLWCFICQWFIVITLPFLLFCIPLTAVLTDHFVLRIGDFLNRILIQWQSRAGIDPIIVLSVDTVFLHVSRKLILVKGRWPIWKKPKDTQGWNRPMEVHPMGQEDILRRYWSANSAARPMNSCRWSQERRRGSELYENLDDSVVVFRVVYL